MKVHAGAIIKIRYNTQKPDEKGTLHPSMDEVYGVLAEDINIKLSSSFKNMYTPESNAMTDLINIAGGVEATTDSQGRGFSAQWKQFSTQIWDKSEPASFSLILDMNRIPINGHSNSYPSGIVLVKKVCDLCKIPLPLEGGWLGSLIPPGPSALQAINFKELFASLKSDPKVNYDNSGDDTDTVVQHGLVSVRIGSKLAFDNLLLRSADPQFSKNCDTSGYPISCKLTLEFVSLWVATHKFVNSWYNRPNDTKVVDDNNFTSEVNITYYTELVEGKKAEANANSDSK